MAKWPKQAEEARTDAEIQEVALVHSDEVRAGVLGVTRQMAIED